MAPSTRDQVSTNRFTASTSLRLYDTLNHVASSQCLPFRDSFQLRGQSATRAWRPPLD
jgi:hypothetical protein